MPFIVWDGVSEHLAESLLTQTTAEEHSQRAAAKDFLLDILKDGPVDSAKVIAQAEAEDLKRRTIWRAKKDLKIVAHKSGFSGGWTWELPNLATY